MLFSTFYFSGTGNTKWAAEQLDRIIRKKGHESFVYSIDRNEDMTDETLKEIITRSDMVGFATPIYASNIAPIMRHFIKRVTDLADDTQIKKKVYMIYTFGFVNAFGPKAADKLFGGSRFELRAAVNVKLFNCVCTPQSKPMQLEDALIKKRKNDALKSLSRMADRLIAGKKELSRYSPLALIGDGVRSRASVMIEETYKAFSVDPEYCTQCMQCIDKCPTKSISINDQGMFVFSKDCTACMRCYNYCPSGALLYNDTFVDPNKSKRYKASEILY